MVTCPECSSPLDFDEDELDIGDEFTCEECGANVRVADKEPLELELADDDDDERDEDDDGYDEEEEEEDLDGEEEEEAEEDDERW